MNEPSESPKRAEKHRERSPNYPVVGLKTAVGLARDLYKREGRHPMSAEIAAKHWGYTLNGRSRTLLSALRKFGLTDLADSGVRVSDDAIVALEYPQDSAEVKAVLRRMAGKPPVFADIISDYPGALPSDENLRGYLITRKKFTPEAADSCIVALKETVEFSGVDGASIAADYQAMDQPQVTAPPNAVDRGRERQAIMSNPGGAQHVWDLGSGVKASLSFSAEPTPKQIARMTKYVALLLEAAEEGGDDDL